MSPQPRPQGLAAEWIVRLSGLWLFLGAAAKLFLGTPKDLPPSVIEIARSMSLTLDLTFRVVIAVELVLVALAWLRPKLAWLPMLAVLAFFEYVLATQLSAGADSCGCFGATITVNPWVMVAIDSAFFLAIVIAKPWRIENDGAPIWVVALAALMGLIAPWALIPKSGPPVAVTSGSGGAGSDDEPGTKAPPTKARYFEISSPDTWTGQMIWDVEDLVAVVDAGLLPSDGKVVLWRQGCDHCAEHLRKMYAEDDGSLPIVLVQIPDDLESARAVDAMPEGAHVTHAKFPEDVQVILTTPWELVVEAGIITKAIGPDDLEEADGH